MIKRRFWTNEEDIYMVNNYEIRDWDVLKSTLKRSEKSIRSRANILGLTREPQQYALYKGEELLGIGTVEDLAKKENVQKSTIRYYLAPSYKKRSEGIKTFNNRRILVRL